MNMNKSSEPLRNRKFMVVGFEALLELLVKNRRKTQFEEATQNL